MKIPTTNPILAALLLAALVLPAATGRAAGDNNDLRPDPRDFASVTRGAGLFQQHCATCHGKQGEGAANWRTPGPDGRFRPPPLNGGGHMWHHPLPVLLSVLRNGTLAQGGTMPAWEEKLSDRQMVDIIAWLQSKWPREIYRQWRELDSRVQARK